MANKPKWVQHATEFLIENLVVITTLGTAAYVTLRQSFSATKMATDDLIAAVLAVLGLLALSEIVERYRRLNTIQQTNHDILSLLQNRLADRPSALSFFVKMPNMDIYVQNALQIDMCGLTLTSAVNRQLSNLRERLKQGATIRILIADPNSFALQMSDLRSEEPNSDYFRKRFDATIQDIQYLYQNQIRLGNDAKGKFEVRLLDFAPSFGIYSFDTHKSNGVTIVEIFPHRSGYSSPPIFDLQPKRDGEWYKYFCNQFEELWQTAKIWQPETIVAK